MTSSDDLPVELRWPGGEDSTDDTTERGAVGVDDVEVDVWDTPDVWDDPSDETVDEDTVDHKEAVSPGRGQPAQSERAPVRLRLRLHGGADRRQGELRRLERRAADLTRRIETLRGQSTSG